MENIEEIKEEYKLLKKEVDALQIELMKGKTPWYKNIPVILSILALVFSFGTTYVSNERVKSQDLQALKSELRGMLQQLTDLPKENFELTQKYTTDPGAIAFIGGQLNQENSLLSSQAASLIAKLPIEEVSAIEAYSVGVSLQNASEMQRAQDMFLLAYDTAITMNDAVAAKRGIANTYFAMGDPGAGRVEFQEALNIFSRFKNHNDYVQKTTHLITLMNWHSAEAGSGFMAKARQRLEEANSIAITLPPGQFTDQLHNQIKQAFTALDGISQSSSTQ